MMCLIGQGRRRMQNTRWCAPDRGTDAARGSVSALARRGADRAEDISPAPNTTEISAAARAVSWIRERRRCRVTGEVLPLGVGSSIRARPVPERWAGHGPQYAARRSRLTLLDAASRGW